MAAAVAVAGDAHLLEFLDARDVAQLLLARSDAVQDRAAVWRWVVSRAQRHMPGVQLPRRPPPGVLDDRALLVALLRRLHVAMTYDFALRFDATRMGSAVRIADSARTTTTWGLPGGSIFGDRVCAADTASYWECSGMSDGSYVGVAEQSPSGGGGQLRFGAGYFQRVLSLPAPACDSMPAIMYCEGGFITNGAFRGPRPRLPSGVSILHAQPFAERDRVGVFVDLLEGSLVFLLNGRVQGVPVPLDRRKSYRPVFSARSCYDFQLIADAVPPWRVLYDLAAALPSSDKPLEPQEEEVDDEDDDDALGNQAVEP